MDPCETFGKTRRRIQECYSGANWANRPQWWKTPKATSPNNIPIPLQPQGQYIKDNTQLAQTQYHTQNNQPNGLPTPSPDHNSAPNPKPRSYSSKNLVLPQLQFEEIVETRHPTTSETPNTYAREENDECHEQPSLDWQRRWQVHKLNRHRRKYLDKKDDPSTFTLDLHGKIASFITFDCQSTISIVDNNLQVH